MTTASVNNNNFKFFRLEFLNTVCSVSPKRQIRAQQIYKGWGNCFPDPAAPTDKEENFYWVLSEISFTKDDVAEDFYDACLWGRSLP